MPPLSQATQPRDISNLALVTGNSAVLRPNPPLASSADPEFDPRSISPIPPVLGTDVDASRQFYRQGVSQVRMPPLPTQAKIAVGAQAASIAQQVVSESIELQVNGVDNPVQTLLNLSGSGVSYGPGPGQVSFTGGGTTDGLTHGTEPPVWESDPAYIVLRDEFLGFHGNGSVPASPQIGQLGWASSQTGGAIRNEKYYTAGNWGAISLNSTSSAGVGSSIVLDGGDSAPSTSIMGFPLTYAGGWDACFIFRYPKYVNDTTANPSTKVRMYIGFAEGLIANGSVASFTPRPAGFIGLRLDTDPNTWTLSAAGNAAGGNTVYTGTFTGATTNALYGQSFTVAGFLAHTVNNGTFKCVGNTTTSITLANASGVAETQAATATGTAFSDSTYMFEAVQNGNIGSNIQGVVANSGISVDNNWHRFRMRSITAGTILCSIDGGAESSLVMGAQTITASAASGEGIQFTQGLHAGGLQTTEITVTNLFTGGAVCGGTPVVIASASGGTLGSFNGTWNAIEFQNQATCWFDTSSISSNAGGTSSTGTVSFYNSFSPFIMMMSDSTGSGTQKAVFIDFFSFVWNPNLSSAAPGTPDPTKARYW